MRKSIHILSFFLSALFILALSSPVAAGPICNGLGCTQLFVGIAISTFPVGLLGVLLLFIWLFRLKVPKKRRTNDKLLLIMGTILIVFNVGLLLYFKDQQTHRFTEEYRINAAAATFNFYTPTYLPTGFRLSDASYPRNPRNANESFLQLIYTGHGNKSVSVSQFDVATTYGTGGNCGPISPELNDPIEQCVPIGTTLSGQQVYSGRIVYGQSQTAVFVTIGSTRISMVDPPFNTGEVLKVFSSLRKTSAEKIPF